MDMRHTLAYGMILALLAAAGAVIWVVRRRARTDRRDARRPIRITRKKRRHD
jgi:uncharacterized membrane protein